MDNIQGKHFSITDPKGVNTVIYQVNKTEKEFLKEYPKYTVERLDHIEEIRGDFNKKTFYVENPAKDGNKLVILSFFASLNVSISNFSPILFPLYSLSTIKIEISPPK